MRITLSAIFIFLAISLSAQTRTRRTVRVVRANNGQIIEKTKIKVTTNFYVDLFNYYKRTTTHTTYYDSISGKKQRETTLITKNGMGGRHCYIVYDHVIVYNSKGKKVHETETWCDKAARKLKEYENGKLVFTSTQRRARQRSSNND